MLVCSTALCLGLNLYPIIGRPSDFYDMTNRSALFQNKIVYMYICTSNSQRRFQSLPWIPSTALGFSLMACHGVTTETIFLEPHKP